MRIFCPILDVKAREILDSRGNPTVETEVTLENAVTGRAAVPSGASTGQFEAVELRDGETRYFGLGVQKAVKNVNTKLKAALLGKNALCQLEIDRILMDADERTTKATWEPMRRLAFHGSGKGCSQSAGNSAVPVSGRNSCETASCPHDEYP